MAVDEDEKIARESMRVGEVAQGLGVRPEFDGIRAVGTPVSGGEFLDRLQARTRRDRRRRLSGVAAAAALVLVVGSLAVWRPWSQERAVAATPPVLDSEFAAATRIAYAPGEDAKPYLEQLARIARTARFSQGTGSAQLVVSDNWYTQIDDSTNTSVVLPQVRRSWLMPDGRVDTAQTTGAALSSDGRGVAVNPAVGLPRGTVIERGTAKEFDPAFVQNLPTDSPGLADALLDHAQCQSRVPGYVRSMCLFKQITDMARMYVIPREVNAGLWGMLAGEKGFTALGSVSDRAGRPGFALSIIDPRRPQYRQLLIISIGTGEVFGDENILIRDDPVLRVNAPAVTSFTTIVKAVRTNPPRQ